ncbi:MAG: hypothetical protein AB1414_16200 [bacterium]
MRKFILLLIIIVSLIPLKINAETYGSISGRVLTDSGIPIEGVFTKVENYKNIDEKISLGSKVIERYSKSNKDGIIKFDNLSSDKYYIEIISLPEQYKVLYKAILPTMPIEFPQGQNLVDINIKVSRFYGTISGKIFKEDGITPFETVDVRLSTKGWSKGYFSRDGNYIFKYEPSNDLWKIILTYGLLNGESEKFYFSDSTLNLSKLDDIKMNISLSSGNITGFYGTLKNPDGTIYTRGNSITIESITYDVSLTVDVTNSNYQIKGLVPGEYKFSIFVGDVEFETTQEEKFKFEKIVIDSTYTISAFGEQKQIDLICDESKIKIIEEKLSPIYMH